jgi:hypothetical protein
MLTFWIRPAAAALLWITIAAITLAELTTVAPSLRAAGAQLDPISAQQSSYRLSAARVRRRF